MELVKVIAIGVIGVAFGVVSMGLYMADKAEERCNDCYFGPVGKEGTE